MKRAGYQFDKEQAKRLGILMSVIEDQQRGLPHEHVVTPHTTALEIAFTRAFFDALPALHGTMTWASQTATATHWQSKGDTTRNSSMVT